MLCRDACNDGMWASPGCSRVWLLDSHRRMYGAWVWTRMSPTSGPLAWHWWLYWRCEVWIRVVVSAVLVCMAVVAHGLPCGHWGKGP